jgi:hypothetical protein
VKVFKKHPDVYMDNPIFARELRAFVSENWERWSQEKPKFFTKKFIASIPLRVLSESIKEELLLVDGYDNSGSNEVKREGD